MTELTYLDRQVFFLEHGSGDPVVLLHAGGSSGRQWSKTIAQLEGEFRIVAPDLWGFGQSQSWPGPGDLSHDAQASLVAQVIAARKLGPVHLVGHSYGGAAAVRLALRRTDQVKSLVLIEPILTPLLQLVGEDEVFAEYFNMTQEFLTNASASNLSEAWRAFIDYRNGPGAWSGLSAKSQERFLAGTDSAIAGFHSNLNNPTSIEDLSTLSMPTLMLCGEMTTAPDRRVTEIIRDHVAGCEYRIIPGADHMSPLSHPQFIADAIRTHIQALS